LRATVSAEPVLASGRSSYHEKKVLTRQRLPSASITSYVISKGTGRLIAMSGKKPMTAAELQTKYRERRKANEQTLRNEKHSAAVTGQAHDVKISVETEDLMNALRRAHPSNTGGSHPADRLPRSGAHLHRMLSEQNQQFVLSTAPPGGGQILPTFSGGTARPPAFCNLS
jgi:hypothetical protein